jgi:hypothetical protein
MSNAYEGDVIDMLMYGYERNVIIAAGVPAERVDLVIARIKEIANVSGQPFHLYVETLYRLIHFREPIPQITIKEFNLAMKRSQQDADDGNCPLCGQSMEHGIDIIESQSSGIPISTKVCDKCHAAWIKSMLPKSPERGQYESNPTFAGCTSTAPVAHEYHDDRTISRAIDRHLRRSQQSEIDLGWFP